MITKLELQHWSRRVVEALPHTNWTSLTQGPRPWLCLSGTHSDSLEEEVQAVTRWFQYRWVWRDTAWEYGVPGYRQGPLLVPLDEPLHAHAVECWLRQQAGFILLGPDEEDVLVFHLQRLRLLETSDGFPISIGLHAGRPLEELCEGLPAHRLSELFGPIKRFIWYAGDERAGEWLFADVPATDRPTSVPEGPVTLTLYDEIALDQASLAWSCATAPVRSVNAFLPTTIRTMNRCYGGIWSTLPTKRPTNWRSPRSATCAITWNCASGIRMNCLPRMPRCVTS
ncbi:hypothetical protein [Burkholderia cepacia]|uniref:hypothetical protein n=1 Tax=Burkholderia cepacia TaxID=292 RepID=UPI000F5AFF38|nr:hypothetical protein [Burkholderia cepacia]